MDKGVEKRMLAYLNALRGTVRHDDYITASVLSNEVIKRCVATKVPDNVDDVYAVLLEVADEFGISNPFTDKDRFYLTYKEGRLVEGEEWERMIFRMNSESRNPVLPTAITNLYIERFETAPNTVLIAEAEKFVPNLKKIIDDNATSKFVLTTQNMVYAKALQNEFGEYENVEIVITDIYRYEFTNQKFDLIFSCPAFGGRTLADDQTFMCREMDMVALENLSLHLNNGGRLVITLPGRITFAAGKVNDLRQFIQMSYRIREIAELPENTLAFTAIKVYLLDIENTRPEDDDIVVKRFSYGERKSRKAEITSLEVKDETFVMLSELEEQGDWSVERIFSQQDEDYLNFRNSNIRKGLIGNVSQIFRGKAVNRKDPSGSIGVVNISNIGDYDIDYENLDHLDEEERKVANYILQEGDVLLPARGTAIRTAIFHEQGYPCIASSNVIVIRPEARALNSTYLKIFLDSPIGNKVISGAQQGVTVMNISYKDLSVIEVPLPSLEEQENSAKEYVKELDNYRKTVAKAEAHWKEVLDKLQKF